MDDKHSIGHTLVHLPFSKNIYHRLNQIKKNIHRRESIKKIRTKIQPFLLTIKKKKKNWRTRIISFRRWNPKNRIQEWRHFLCRCVVMTRLGTWKFQGTSRSSDQLFVFMFFNPCPTVSPWKWGICDETGGAMLLGALISVNRVGDDNYCYRTIVIVNYYIIGC